MTRFYGMVGYGATVENPPGSGIWVPSITENPYYGDVVRSTTRLESGEKVNDNVVIHNSISIVMDEYAETHFFNIKYVVWQGFRWKVSSIEVQRPRIILSIGDPYHGPIPEED